MLAVYGRDLMPIFYRLCPEHEVKVSLAMEAIGDITASAEVSQLAVDGEEFDTRIQGGILVSIPGLICWYFHRCHDLGRWFGRLPLGAFYGYPAVRVCPGVPSCDVLSGGRLTKKVE